MGVDGHGTQSDNDPKNDGPDDDCAESCDEGADSCTAADPDGTPCSNDSGTCSGGICTGGEGDGGGCSCRLLRRTPGGSPAGLLLKLLGLGLVLQRRRR